MDIYHYVCTMHPERNIRYHKCHPSGDEEEEEEDVEVMNVEGDESGDENGGECGDGSDSERD